MSHEVRWTKIAVEEFVRLGGLTEMEEEIIRTRAAGWTRVEQAMKLGVSIATVDRLIRSCREKYDECEAFSPILKPRVPGSPEFKALR